MAIGIWTPVLNSAVQVSFSERLNSLANRTQQITLAAGTHMRFTNMGCHPIYVHSSAPATDVIGLTGVPIYENSNVVLPRTSPVWIYSPYDNSTTIVDVGALT